MEQHFQLQGKNYTCYAFSNPPYPFVRPANFDDIFADELNFLEQALSNKNKIDKKKAFVFFKRYANQPIYVGNFLQKLSYLLYFRWGSHNIIGNFYFFCTSMVYQFHYCLLAATQNSL
ncbi:hypothetical protein [Histophilus somni]|uniref:hypothetical protein n=1 Tax=Histophilus somni TaxID=731 RepID=UPI00201F1B73|nr:hypothetical protein [Histophilus somni]